MPAPRAKRQSRPAPSPEEIQATAQDYLPQIVRFVSGTIVDTPASPADPEGHRRARVVYSGERVTRVQFRKGYPATFETSSLKAAK